MMCRYSYYTIERMEKNSSNNQRWVPGPVTVCYESPSATLVDQNLYHKYRQEALSGVLYQDIEVPAKSGRAWKLKQGDLCRISLISGSQVGDLNFWNLNNTKEHFYSGKTRQLHSSHLSIYDRLWSNLPYLNPMATIVGDSIQYGIDNDGAGVHDVIGTRCDQYTMRLITGNNNQEEDPVITCHGNLTKAILPFGLNESDVHDVWNIFMCTGFSKNENKYFSKASPARIGDYVEFIADMDLLVALSACPQGDVSIPVGKFVPPHLCHPLKVQVFHTV